jgi:hypothetical protein
MMSKFFNQIFAETQASITKIVRSIAMALLPEPILYELCHLRSRRKPRTDLPTASRHHRISPQAGVELWVYWSDVPGVGSGPSASLFVLNEEVFRLDCFGGTEGHMHLNPEQQIIVRRQTARIYFPDDHRAAQVNRAAFELATNSRAALLSNGLRRVRTFHLDERSLADAANQMHSYMNELLIGGTVDARAVAINP